MAGRSHDTGMEIEQGAEACPVEVPTPIPDSSGEQTIEEITYARPESVESPALDAQNTKDLTQQRPRGRSEPRSIERSIDEIHVDSRYGGGLLEAGALGRLLLRMNLLNEEGVRLLCRAIPIRISVIDGSYYAFGGMLSYELAWHCLRSSRQIRVLCYEDVSEREVLDAAFVDQIILPALLLTNDQVESSLLAELLKVQRLRPEIFARSSKAKLIADFGQSPRNFRAKSSTKKPIRGEEDAA